MPSPDPATKEDREKLVEILEHADSILQTVVNSRNVLFDHKVREVIVPAWVIVKDRIKDAISVLDKNAPSTQFDSSIVEAGLSGEELTLKYIGAKEAFHAFEARGTVFLLRKAMGWLNVFLGSLATFIPGIEGVKEFKETAEEAMDDAPSP